jgi:hypothetical protein
LTIRLKENGLNDEVEEELEEFLEFEEFYLVSKKIERRFVKC